MCELNNRTKEARPEDFVPDSDRYYYGRVRNRVPLGSIPELPAESCKEIKASEGGQLVSGKYWFDSIIPGNVGLAHCDMETEDITDIDECDISIHDCLNDLATCTNTLGSFTCTCNSGYVGDGKTSCVPLPEECLSYTNLTDGKRKVTAIREVVLCDSELVPGWYRFQGDAGTRMPTTCPPKYSCNTHAPGWLNGAHPTVAEGQVIRQVCFHWQSSCCYNGSQWPKSIQVRNCGSYYVYYLIGTNCSLRYCSTD
ncbi:pancreatic secretory granule membrane major glycoprotein GP2-like [Oculina patagonica]